MRNKKNGRLEEMSEVKDLRIKNKKGEEDTVGEILEEGSGGK